MPLSGADAELSQVCVKKVRQGHCHAAGSRSVWSDVPCSQSNRVTNSSLLLNIH